MKIIIYCTDTECPEWAVSMHLKTICYFRVNPVTTRMTTPTVTNFLYSALVMDSVLPI